jgi:serine phosphatase RsbU (regulator of sigma subunit)
MTASIEDLLHESAEKTRLEEKLRVARSIQESLLPKKGINVLGLSISELCSPATEIGGTTRIPCRSRTAGWRS